VHCSLKPEAVAERADSGWRASELDGTLDIPPGHIRALLLHLADELRAPGFASEAMVELVCGQIAIEISRYRQVALHCDRPQGLEPWQLRAVEERLAGDGKTPTLAELAGICSLSVRQLTRGYRLSQGRSIGDAIANMRIAQAKQMLVSGQSLKWIAHALGFASPSGFTYAFHTATGETPRAFQKRGAH
jgi:AraC family transcriptional regulator